MHVQLERGFPVSQTESWGVVEAGRWVGVAASMAEYLHRWLEAEVQPAPPLGTFAGARRFFSQVLEGIALSRGKRPTPDIPVMAGLSNWNIAIDVLTHLPQAPQKFEEVEPIINECVQCIQEIGEGRKRSPKLSKSAELLRNFFLELLKQGNRARQSAFARAESPLV
jgi:hypothetical protein